MYTTTTISNDLKRALMLRSFHDRSSRYIKPPTLAQFVLKQCGIIKPRKDSEFGSKAYRDALQRAFNRAKEQIYFNPDMQYFVTLTYAGIEDDYTQVMHDIKQLCKQERRKGNIDLKYIYVLEWQKRGSLHVHMITNNQLTTHLNKNGHPSLTYWKHGFTSMLSIKDFDHNFKPYLYLFKYMRKAQRIGKSFIHSSRNLNNFTKHSDPLDLMEWRTVNQERSEAFVENTHFIYLKNYLCYDDGVPINQLTERKQPWQSNTKLLFMKESEKIQRNHSRLSG